MKLSRVFSMCLKLRTLICDGCVRFVTSIFDLSEVKNMEFHGCVRLVTGIFDFLEAKERGIATGMFDLSEVKNIESARVCWLTTITFRTNKS